MEETTPIVGGDGGGGPANHEEEEEEEEVEESRYGWMVVAASFLCNVVIDGESPCTFLSLSTLVTLSVTFFLINAKILRQQ